MSQWIGIDIGGANLKVADQQGRADSHPFALWKNPEGLADELARVVGKLSVTDNLAVVMTGELCDCFSSKAAGVSHIVDAVVSAFPRQSVFFYQIGGRWVDAEQARCEWTRTAASNWDALARWVAQYLPGQSGILMDIGSTTTDIIPIVGGQPRTLGLTDWTRMQHGELVYTGIVRTPVGGVLPRWKMVDPQSGSLREIPIAQEYFANMQDVYVVLGDVSRGDDGATADGRPADLPHARHRLARLLCADELELEEKGQALLLELARQAAENQLNLIAGAARRVAERDWSIAGNWLASGSGAWLADRVIRSVFPRASVESLAEKLSPAVATAAPAWAAAHLAWASSNRSATTA